jgi:Flp pilus assembly protein TadB
MTPRAETRAEQHQPIAEERYEVAPDLRRRREVAAQVRRRRLLLADVGLGVALALLGLLLAPGLAIAAFGALVVLAGCAAWIAIERLARRRAEAGKSGVLEDWRAALSRRLRDHGLSHRWQGPRR